LTQSQVSHGRPVRYDALAARGGQRISSSLPGILGRRQWFGCVIAF
jgi:hypothetical protein